MRVKFLTALVVVLAVAGCGGGGDSDSAALTTSERRYCELVKQFGSRMPDVPRDAEPELFTARMSDALAKNTEYFDELVKVAPDEIKKDVEKAITTLQRAAGGDIAAYEGLDLTKADQWEEDHCNR
ncbi:MAG: hypothetical protein AB1679_31585 [Actinomycetota bacterium]|jgi:hypothetical protein